MTASEVGISRKNNVNRPPHLIALDSSSWSSAASSTASSSSFSSSPSSRRVRSKYLQRIGIVRTSHMIDTATKSILITSTTKTTRDLRNVPRFNAPLQYNDVHRRERRNSEGSEDRKRVNFQENVTVVPIPMRSEYSDRIKAKLWRGRVEMCEIVGKLYPCIMCSLRRSASSHIARHISLFLSQKQSETSRNSPPKIITGAPYAPKNICTFATTPESLYILFTWNWDVILSVLGGELPEIKMI